jgi:uncharacterized protein (TIGR02996 family)
VDAIHKDPRDVDTRNVLADWYDDHGEPELAAEQRNFSLEKYDAGRLLRSFADRYAGGDYEGMKRGLLDGEYCFDNDDGPYAARHDDELWDALRVLTGEDLPDEHREEARFRCAC